MENEQLKYFREASQYRDCDLSPCLKHGFIIAYFRQFVQIPQVKDLL